MYNILYKQLIRNKISKKYKDGLIESLKRFAVATERYEDIEKLKEIENDKRDTSEKKK